MDNKVKPNDLLNPVNINVDKENTVGPRVSGATTVKTAATTVVTVTTRAKNKAAVVPSTSSSAAAAAIEAIEKNVVVDSAANKVTISKTPKTTRRWSKRNKRKFLITKDLQSELKDCNIEDAVALEHKIREIAHQNSLSHDEMMKLLRKFIKNEHVLALVTLKAEDEIAREISTAKPAAILITDTPTVPKLTRSKARAMKCNPFMPLATSKLTTVTNPPEIRSLIEDDLSSDEDDEEFIVHDDDLLSDDDGTNVTASDLESCPHSPQTPATPAAPAMPLEIAITSASKTPTTETTSAATASLTGQDSIINMTTSNISDGYFKIPFDKHSKNVTPEKEDLRIAARTRSKLCLEQTTIEDLQSEFIPPDVEDYLHFDDTQLTGTDNEWLQFLNDFNKPLTNSQSVDDDDPVNDPEYVAADLDLGKWLQFFLIYIKIMDRI